MRYFLYAALFFTAISAQAQELRIYNWKDYIDPSLIEGFERETGISVNYQTYATAEELYAALDAGTEFDLVVPSHFQLQRLIMQKKLRPLDLRKLSRYGNVDPKLIASLAGFSSSERYVVPYLWATVGLAFDSSLVGKLLGEPAPHSWRLLFDTKYISKLKPCGIGWLDAPVDTFSLWMNLQGKRLPDASPRRLIDAGEQLLNYSTSVRTLGNEFYIEQLSAGSLCVAMAWSGHALQAMTNRSDLDFIVPEEGGLLTIDSWGIPQSSKNPELAYRFIDYMLDPRNARLNTETTRFYAPLRADLPEMTELQSLKLVLPASERRRLYFLEPINREQNRVIDERWKIIKQQYSMHQRPEDAAE
ncbi:Putrescine-binding periplasmic protein [Pseudomonas sp. Bi70]|uniref:extracellular solute-binding protein n=1 Tax=Pseudomonas sp. Bi70 TaxID=2821127 RepID=UPI001D4C5E69|nr:extracellular solute-binding protein [Pseudomonas sp. Bi70]CAH0143661.1 Putrescine-binding periplasmic protein [Pseudomonas sp. Bi70]